MATHRFGRVTAASLQEGVHSGRAQHSSNSVRVYCVRHAMRKGSPKESWKAKVAIISAAKYAQMCSLTAQLRACSALRTTE
jgi:hypothetical protein